MHSEKTITLSLPALCVLLPAIRALSLPATSSVALQASPALLHDLDKAIRALPYDQAAVLAAEVNAALQAAEQQATADAAAAAAAPEAPVVAG